MHSCVKLWGFVLFPGSMLGKRWSAWWVWNRQDVIVKWCDPEGWGPAGKTRAGFCHLDENRGSSPVCVSAFCNEKRKADQHHTWLGGRASWQRSEQSRWCEQVRLTCFITCLDFWATHRSVTFLRSFPPTSLFHPTLGDRRTRSNLKWKTVKRSVELICLSFFCCFSDSFSVLLYLNVFSVVGFIFISVSVCFYVPFSHKSFSCVFTEQLDKLDVSPGFAGT